MKIIIQLIALMCLSLGFNTLAAQQNNLCSECVNIFAYAEKLDLSKETNVDKQIELFTGAMDLLKKASVSLQIKGKYSEELVKSVLYLLSSTYKYDVHNLSSEIVLNMHSKDYATFNKVIKSLPQERKQLVKRMLGLAKKVDEKGNG